MKVNLFSDFGMPMPPTDDLISAVKLTIARFARGNTAVQQMSVLLPSEQEVQRVQAEKIASEWERRAEQNVR